MTSSKEISVYSEVKRERCHGCGRLRRGMMKKVDGIVPSGSQVTATICKNPLCWWFTNNEDLETWEMV